MHSRLHITTLEITRWPWPVLQTAMLRYELETSLKEIMHAVRTIALGAAYDDQAMPSQRPLRPCITAFLSEALTSPPMVAGGSHPSLHASACLLLCACITLCVTLAGAQYSCIVCLCFVLYEGRVWSCSTGQTPNFLAIWRSASQMSLSFAHGALQPALCFVLSGAGALSEHPTFVQPDQPDFATQQSGSSVILWSSELTAINSFANSLIAEHQELGRCRRARASEVARNICTQSVTLSSGAGCECGILL